MGSIRTERPPSEAITRRQFVTRTGAYAAGFAVPGWIPGHSNEAKEYNGPRLLRFAHLTDLHFTSRVQSRYPTSHRHIVRAVEALNSEWLDFVLFTGDMFHFPEDFETELPALRDALKGLNCPYYCLFGNHDAEGTGLRQRKLRIATLLGDRGLAEGNSYYSFTPVPGLRIIALDTTDTGEDHYHGWGGTISQRQFVWLREILRAARDETVFLALHHPPITPYPFLEKLRLEPKTAHRLGQIIAEHTQVQLAFAGHYHFGACDQFAGAHLIIGPSLVEHPHPYRLFELFQTPEGALRTHFSWHTLPLHEHEDERCVWSLAGIRGHSLQQISYARTGNLLIRGPG
ncbi:MAG: metallophosphoesterase [Candidatus Sericytochromatia bacterium]|nr:metallophosphoesterase [Candidatus Sericytochromatia bacterium]